MRHRDAAPPRAEEKVRAAAQHLTFRPATASRWRDIVRLFGPRGACAGCWCMYWRRTRSEFERGKGAGNRGALRRVVRSGEVPGLLAYDGPAPVAWCAVAPRDAFPVLGRSRILQPVDDTPVWSITCLFVRRDYRRRGVTVPLLRAAADLVGGRGGRVAEGYPVDPGQTSYPATFAFTGLASAFRQAGFKEVARRSATRPIMRIRVR
jgi:GNAT superfamily N-acetyltransferase